MRIWSRTGPAPAVVAMFALVLGLGWPFQPAGAQAPAPTAPSGAPVADPAFEAARRSFEALPEADRRNIQDALIWTGDYKGTVDGGFGRGTRGAIVAYAQRVGLAADGTLDQRGRAMLFAAAALARNAVGFAVQTDPRTGVSLALPLKTLAKRTDTPQGSRWATADGTVSVETIQVRPGGDDLPALFDKLKDSSPSRKVTYKLLRPDFFIVSGEMGKSTFYTRMARAPAESGAGPRGFTMIYPTGNKGLENVSIAVASSFMPFPSSATPAVPAPGSGVALAPDTAQRRPPASVVATGVLVAPERVLTVVTTCFDPHVGGRTAKMLRHDEGSGLTLLEVPGLGGPTLANTPALAQARGQILVLFQARRVGSPQAADLSLAAGEVLSPGTAGAGQRILAPVQAGGQGAPVFDRGGTWIGMVGLTGSPRQVAGIVPQAAWPLLGQANLSPLLSAAGSTHPEASGAPDTKDLDAG